MFKISFKEFASAQASYSPLKFIFTVCKGYYHYIFFDIFFSFLRALFETLVLVISSAMIGYFAGISLAEFSWKTTITYLSGIMAFSLLIHVIRFFRDFIGENIRNMIRWQVEEYALTYASGHSVAYLKQQKSGQIANRIIKLGVACWEQMLSFTRFSSCFWLIFINLFFIGRASLWFLSLVIGFGLFSSLLSLVTSRKITYLNKISAAEQTKFSGEVTDSLSNILLIKIFGQEKNEIDKLQHDLQHVNRAATTAVKNEEMFRALQLVTLTTFQICSSFLALYLWKLQKIGVADVVLILMLSVNILSYFTRLLYEMINIRTSLGQLTDALTFLRVPHEIVDIPDASALLVKKGKIEFKNITFGYSIGKKIFHNFSLTINPGEKVGIVGKSGSGKSTLINLLQRNYDIESGEILIDGQNIARVSIHSVKQALAVIAQDSQIFHRTIRRNIAFGSPDATERQIFATARRANADGFIKEMPHGYLTITGERGVKLSGGQRQRITIARALLKKAPILILDEATSALDNQTENEVVDAINTLMNKKTVIAIAHRLSTLKKMDRIIVLEKGKIAEEGSLDALLDKQGKFAQLWKLQQE